MKVTAKKIADLLNGEVEGNEQVLIDRLSKIEEAGEGSVSFLANPRYTPHIYTTNASAVVVSKDFIPEKPVKTTLIRVDDPYKAFTELLELYNGSSVQKAGIESPSFIHPAAKIGKNVYVAALAYIDENAEIGDNVKIFPHVYIGANVKIGDNTVLYPGVTIYHDCVIGKNVIIHSGSVIGSDGFGFAPDGQDYKKIPQIGNVVIEDNVEIGSNTTIDRATLGSTIIRKGVKLDNQIQVAHNVEIGENTVIAAKTGISGSVKIGRNCQIGGQVGIAGHLKIGNNVKVGAQSGITRNVQDGEILIGSPAIPHKQFKKSAILFKQLGDMYAEIQHLKAELKKFKTQT